MEKDLLKNILEAALLAAGRPLSLKEMAELFDARVRPERAELREALDALQVDYEDRGIELVEVATGFRVQIRAGMIDWLTKLWEQRPPRYSRALMETLALIAYRQPITRGDIEEVRGVAVSTNIVRTLLERGWVRIVGHREVPGRPALLGTTPQFLEYFGLKKLEDLPPLEELTDLDSLNPELQLEFPVEEGVAAALRVVEGAPAEAVETTEVADPVEAGDPAREPEHVAATAETAAGPEEEPAPDKRRDAAAGEQEDEVADANTG